MRRPRGCRRSRDDGDDQQNVEQVERGTQQPGVGAQLAQPRLVVLVVGAGETAAEAADAAGGLQHAHARDAFDICALMSLRSSRERATAALLRC
jgi:hypothetical protein